MPCYKIVTVKLVIVKVVMWTSVAPNHCTKVCRYSSSGLPRPRCSNNFKKICFKVLWSRSILE